MASSRYDDDYEEMLIEYFQDNTPKNPKPPATAKVFVLKMYSSWRAMVLPDLPAGRRLGDRIGC